MRVDEDKIIERMVDAGMDFLEIGLDNLDDEELEDVVTLGENLVEKGSVFGYELLGRAYVELEIFDMAKKVLKEGEKNFPQEWKLVLLLGNTYAAEKQFKQSYSMYEKAMNIPEVDSVKVHKHWSAALIDDGRHEDAFECVNSGMSTASDMGDDSEMIALVSLKVQALAGLKKYDEAMKIAGKAVEKFGDIELHDEQIKFMANVFGYIGFCAYKKEEDEDEVIDFALRAIEIYRDCKVAQWLIRDIEDDGSRGAKYFKVMIEGQWEEEGDETPPGFVTAYEVVARNIEEAFVFIKRFEPESVLDSLKVDDYEITENAVDKAKGVYAVSGYVFFDEE